MNEANKKNIAPAQAKSTFSMPPPPPPSPPSPLGHSHTFPSSLLWANNGQQTYRAHQKMCARAGMETCLLITKEFPILIFAVAAALAEGSFRPLYYLFCFLRPHIFFVVLAGFSACFFLACGKVNNCDAIRICQHFPCNSLFERFSFVFLLLLANKRRIKRLLSHIQMGLVAWQ